MQHARFTVLTGHLNEYPLPGLIAILRHGRKSGRLLIDYPKAPGIFYFKDGELVDAEIGTLSGLQAIYVALSLPNASFNFNPVIQPPRYTISSSLQKIMLDILGLNHLDEGASAYGETPTKRRTSKVFSRPAPASAVNEIKAADAPKALAAPPAESTNESAKRQQESPAASAESATLPVTETVKDPAPSVRAPVTSPSPAFNSASTRYKPQIMFAAMSSVLLICTLGFLAFTGRFGKGEAPAVPATMSFAEAPPLPSSSGATNTEAATNPASAETASTASAETPATSIEAAPKTEPSEDRGKERRPAGEQFKAERIRNLALKRDEAVETKTADAAPPSSTEDVKKVEAANKQERVGGGQAIAIEIQTDENGRVSRASVANSRPGMEAYEASALRIARQRRYSAGKNETVVIKLNAPN